MPLIDRALRRPSAASPWTSDEILRAELFSIERLEQHAASLAVAQRVTRRPMARRTLGARLRDNEAVLLAAYRDIAAATGEGRAISPAAEWLLDNYHIVEEQIREIREDLPPSFYRLLPKLADGPLNGYPRVLGVAWAFVAHTDSRFDPETLRSFRTRLSARSATDHRRALGGRDHAADRTRGESPPRCGTHREQSCRAPGSRRPC